MKLSSTDLDTIRDYFEDKPVLKVYLFGSYARGDADQQSDVDLLLQLDYSQKVGLQYVRMQLDLEDILQKKVEFSSEDFLKPRIKAAIETEKELIYEKS
jgi:uncharacterized protein